MASAPPSPSDPRSTSESVVTRGGFRLLRRTQTVRRTVEEVYLRDDIACGSALCSKCAHLESDPALPPPLCADATHFAVPDARALAENVDAFLAAAVPGAGDVVLLATALRAAHARGDARLSRRSARSPRTRATRGGQAVSQRALPRDQRGGRRAPSERPAPEKRRRRPSRRPRVRRAPRERRRRRRARARRAPRRAGMPRTSRTKGAYRWWWSPTTRRFSRCARRRRRTPRASSCRRRAVLRGVPPGLARARRARARRGAPAGRGGGGARVAERRRGFRARAL